MLSSMLSQNSLLHNSTMSSNCATTFSVLMSGYKPLYFDRDDIDEEEVRKQTFLMWPKWAPKYVTAESMAKAGLFFTGDSDNVKCFECKVELGGWKEGDVPLERHRLQSPHCPFLAQLGLNEDDLEMDGEEEEEEDFVDGAIRPTVLESKSSPEKFESLLRLPDVDASKKTPPNGFDKNKLKCENEKLRDAMMCRKCKTERIQTLFLPCRHLITCEECADKMDDCMACNQRILGTVRTYMV